jgi:NAD(P)-dependent dehydrogenase (short-subunit alcohol dehydrogenase family)
LVLASRTEKKLKALAEELGERALAVPTDVSDWERVRDLFEAALWRFGHLHAVIVTVGKWAQLGAETPVDAAVELAREHFQTFFLSPFVLGLTAGHFFGSNGGGLFVNISSQAAVRQLLGNLTYGPMKSASRQFTLSLLHELAASGFRAVDIQPAIVNTRDNSDALGTDERRALAVQPEAIATWLIEHFDDPDLPAEKRFDSEVIL